MYKEKIQSFINNYKDERILIMDTLFIQYENLKDYHTVIRFNSNDNKEIVFEVLNEFKNGTVIFDDLLFWVSDENQYNDLKIFAGKLKRISTKNNLVIFT